MDNNQIAVEIAYSSGYDAGKQAAIESIFEDLDLILLNTYSDTYGCWKGLDKEVAKLKKKYDDSLDISDEVVDELIDRFNGSILMMSWDEWNDDELHNKESIVESILESGDFDDIDENKIYEIFWDWAAGITEDDFYDEYLDRFNSI